MKRIALFLATNLAVMLVLSVSASVLGLNTWLGANGINHGQLLAFCALFGFGGAGISLLISKPVAKWTTKARVITGDEGATEAWLVSSVQEFSQKAGIQTPEVAIFEGAPNAFATGAFKNSALVAVSSGLLQSMSREEVRAVLAHEVAHVANGDMQTMTLLQGVVNTFVMFAARVIGNVVDRALFRHEGAQPGLGYMGVVLVLEIVFGVLASIIVMAFSRRREYRADWEAANLMGSAVPMQRALASLSNSSSDLPKQVAAFGISGGASKWLSLLKSHPPIEQRIAALEHWAPGQA